MKKKIKARIKKSAKAKKMMPVKYGKFNDNGRLYLLYLAAIILVAVPAFFFLINFKTEIIDKDDITAENRNTTKIIPGQKECQKYKTDICPSDCMVCNRCLECSSLTCNSQSFCQALEKSYKSF